MTDSRPARKPRGLLHRAGHGHAADDDRPLGGYAAAMAGFTAFTTAWATAVRLRGRPLPARPEPWDVVLTSVATFRLGRPLSKASVTSPLRAPFTRCVGPQGPAEPHEEARPEHGKHTVGELATCPFCMSVRVASALAAGRLLRPHGTRTAMGALTAPAAADALQPAYGALAQKATAHDG